MVEDEIADCICTLDGIRVGDVGGQEGRVVRCYEKQGGGVGPELNPEG